MMIAWSNLDKGLRTETDTPYKIVDRLLHSHSRGRKNYTSHEIEPGPGVNRAQTEKAPQRGEAPLDWRN